MQFYSVTAADEIRALARAWHEKCKDKNCPCQHVLGDLLNRRKAEAAHMFQQLMLSNGAQLDSPDPGNNTEKNVQVDHS